MLKTWGSRKCVEWGIFICIGMLGGILTFIHPATIVAIVILGAFVFVFQKHPEIFIPLYVFSGYYKSIIPGPDITLMFFMLVILAVCLTIYNNSEIIANLVRTPGVAPMTLFLFLIVLSLIYTNSNQAAIEKASKVILLTGGAFFAPMILIRSLRQLQTVFLCIVCLGTVMSFISVVTGERTVFGSNYLSLGFISSLSIVILLFYFYGKTKSPLLFIPILINVIAMLNSAARGPIFFLPLTFFITIALSKLKFQKKIKTYVIVSISSIFTLIALYIVVPQSFHTLLLRLSAMESTEQDANTQYRAHHIEQALHLLYSEPITGIGIGGYGISSEGIDDARIYPHNILLEIGAELGIVGLLTFLLIIVSVFGHYFLHRGGCSYIDNTFIACAFYSFLNTLKAGNLVDNRTFFLFLGLILTIHVVVKREGNDFES